nr:hypothetical protein FFPRI1PSEUD_26670 [Pseudomonas sp. FFPRI_1]
MNRLHANVCICHTNFNARLSDSATAAVLAAGRSAGEKGRGKVDETVRIYPSRTPQKEVLNLVDTIVFEISGFSN